MLKKDHKPVIFYFHLLVRGLEKLVIISMCLYVPMPCVGRTVIKKHTSCLRKLSHSYLISFLTLRVTVTSALTHEGAFSPMLGLATSTTAKLVMGCAIRAQPPKYTLPSSARLRMICCKLQRKLLRKNLQFFT